jgi:hypothetical protein
MEPMMSEDIIVWNRAALEAGGPSPRKGDVALSAMLLIHGLIMNGGVFHAIESVGPAELRAANTGYRFFGLSEIAELLEECSKTVPDEELEASADNAYWTSVPTDHTLREAFARHFSTHRQDYAPVNQK